MWKIFCFSPRFEPLTYCLDVFLLIPKTLPNGFFCCPAIHKKFSCLIASNANEMTEEVVRKRKKITFSFSLVSFLSLSVSQEIAAFVAKIKGSGDI